MSSSNGDLLQDANKKVSSKKLKTALGASSSATSPKTPSPKLIVDSKDVNKEQVWIPRFFMNLDEDEKKAYNYCWRSFQETWLRNKKRSALIGFRND